MLQDKGADAAMFVVVGSGLTGLWSSLLFISGNSINSERWSGRWRRWRPSRLPLKWLSSGRTWPTSAVPGLDGVRLFDRRLCLWLFTVRPAAGPVLCLGDPGRDRLHQLRPGHCADLRHESGRTGLAERNGVSRLHSVWVSLSDRHAARLDDAHLLAAAAILGGGGAAWDIHRRRADQQTLFTWGMLLLFSVLDLLIASRLFKYMLYKARADATLGLE